MVKGGYLITFWYITILPVSGGNDQNVQSWRAYNRCYLSQERRIYTRWGFQRFSRCLITSCIKRDRTIPYGHDLHTIRRYLTQETRVYIIFTFLWLSLLWRGSGPLFETLQLPSPTDNLYQVWLNLDCWFWRRRFLKSFSVFLLFSYYFPLERDNPLIWTNFPLPPQYSVLKDELCQVWWKSAEWFWRRIRKCKNLMDR
jgi:hypothetical protein